MVLSRDSVGKEKMRVVPGSLFSANGEASGVLENRVILSWLWSDGREQHRSYRFHRWRAEYIGKPRPNN